MKNEEYIREQEIVKKIANEMLEIYGVKGFPTPIDKIIEFNKLKCSKYDLQEKGFLESVKEKLKPVIKVFQKIKAFLNPNDREILIDRSIHPAKEDFAKSHELGHFKIDWHRDILYVCSEYDLDYTTRRTMEREANYFASETLFQGDKFIEMAQQFPLNMKTVLCLKELCGASYEATARRYVETNHKPCALLVLQPIQTFVDSGKVLKNPFDNTEKTVLELGDKELKRKYVIYSDSFFKKYGKLHFKEKFPPEHPISEIVNAGISEDVMEREITLNGNPVKIHIFYNRYNVLALLLG